VLLDHRSGNGGTLAGPSILWDYFVERRPSDVYVDRQRAEDERPSLAEGQAIWEAALERGWVNHVGSSSPDGIDVKVALLLTRDVSASDWLPLGLKGSPNARIFAPFETNGAFSTRYMLGYWLGLRYVLASGDTFIATGETLNGHGVEPDVVVLPLQSDLVVGRDTLFEVALAWLREESTPTEKETRR
jgi:C-terminal processing protease CtpA/Prc